MIHGGSGVDAGAVRWAQFVFLARSGRCGDAMGHPLRVAQQTGLFRLNPFRPRGGLEMRLKHRGAYARLSEAPPHFID